MTTIIIPAKMSGTGSIHDLASPHYDREIEMPKNAEYAVVLADYYGGRGYTTHETWEAALEKSCKKHEFSHAILDKDGYTVEPHGYYDEPRRTSYPYPTEE